MIERLERASLSDAVIDYFREMIEGGEWKPGDKLPSERVLMERLGISRFCLREGLARLSALGVITIRQGSGSFLCETVQAQSLRNVLLPMFSELDEGQFGDLIEARALLETSIARKAAAHRTGADLAELRLILQEAGEALDRGERFAVLDARFHMALGRIAGNVFFMRMQEMLLRAVEEFIAENSRTAATRATAGRDHERILSCVELGDAEAAAAAMQRHIDTCAANYARKPR